MNILVLDDERWIRKGIVKMIDKEINDIDEIYEAGSIEEAERIFMKYNPEIVISDVRLSVGNGCDFCLDIYSRQQGTMFIMLSGYDDFNYARAALSYHAVDYLLKPVEKSTLNQVIKKACDNWKREYGHEIQCVEERFHIGIEVIIESIVHDIENSYATKISLTEFSDKYHVNEAYL